jgi:hypothetical protein
LQKPLETLADLLMGEVLATLESVLATFHGLDKAGFFLEIARQHILHQVVGIPALLGGRVRELRFEFPGDMYFHLAGSYSEHTVLRYRAGTASGRNMPGAEPSPNHREGPPAVWSEAKDREVVVQGGRALDAEPPHYREAGSVHNREVLVAV